AARGTLRLPYSVILTGRPQPLQMIFMIFAIIGICCILNRENFKRDLRIFGIFLAVGFAANFAVATVENQYVNITFLDIGQGDSAVIRRGRQAVIIDGGGAFGRAIGENVGIFTLVPYLNYRGIVRVPAIVSHNDSDHAIGIIEAINAGRISELFIAYAAIDEEDSIYRELISAAEQSGISVRHLSAGDLLEVFGVSFSVLHPKADTHFRGNDASLIIRTVYGNTSVLFTGDIESAGERALLENFSGNLEVDILKIAHHGSRTSTTSEFLERANPSLAIISAGRDNMYGHPHPSVLERLRDGGISYLVTADVGAVLMRTDGQEISIRVMSREITGRR
ncbi:MAG: MBL fold metallo-hydrolase, partial [Defluviitaleaceae bacterium]|nr:MBL fold metallo-hydrolase [Defluviitaleaceae bacterium]